MVNISTETPQAVDARLRRVIQQARLTIYDAPFAFEEFPHAAFAVRADPTALALVRDDTIWSQLRPARAGDAESFALWRYHFPAGVDNSGFVGWLALHLKGRFGTGVFVVCGQNSEAGGIFDYWGCPWSLAYDVHAEVRALATGVSTN